MHFVADSVPAVAVDNSQLHAVFLFSVARRHFQCVGYIGKPCSGNHGADPRGKYVLGRFIQGTERAARGGFGVVGQLVALQRTVFADAE